VECGDKRANKGGRPIKSFRLTPKRPLEIEEDAMRVWPGNFYPLGVTWDGAGASGPIPNLCVIAQRECNAEVDEQDAMAKFTTPEWQNRVSYSGGEPGWCQPWTEAGDDGWEGLT